MNLMVMNAGLSITPIIANTNPSSKNTTISHHAVKIGTGNIYIPSGRSFLRARTFSLPQR